MSTTSEIGGRIRRSRPLLRATSNLRSHRIFDGVPEDVLSSCLASFESRRYRANATLLDPTDPNSRVHLIHSGKIRLDRVTSANKKTLVALLGSGDLCGEDSIFPENDAHVVWATVMSSTWVSSISAPDFVRLLRLHGSLSMNVAKHFQELRNAEQRFHLEYASKNLGERIMRALERLCSLYGSSHPAGVRIDARLTQGEVASLVGSTRESVSKEVGRLMSARHLLRIDGFFVLPLADSSELSDSFGRPLAAADNRCDVSNGSFSAEWCMGDAQRDRPSASNHS